MLLEIVVGCAVRDGRGKGWYAWSVGNAWKSGVGDGNDAMASFHKCLVFY